MRADLRRVALVMAVAVMAVAVELWAGSVRGDEKDVPFDKLPGKITASLKRRFPKAQMVRAQQNDEGGKTTIEVTILDNGKNIDITYTPAGLVEGLEMELAVSDLPQKLKDVLAKKHPKTIVKKVGAVFERQNKKEVFAFYDVALETADQRQVDVKIGLDGRIKADAQNDDDSAWTHDFPGEKDQLTSTGKNPFFVLEPGYQLVLEEGKDRMTITVLDETKTIDGVETRVVEQRVASEGEVAEVSRDYFAISKRTNNVYHFGVDLDLYKDGKVAGHDGSWLTGVNGARFGLAMPGLPLIGARYYQEIAPGAAMDRAEILGLDKAVKVPAGEFKDCLLVEQSTALESAPKKPKLYAPGVGLLRDGTMSLVQFGKAAAAKK